MEPDQFREWRKSLNLTQGEAAGKLGLGKRTVAAYETTGGIPKHVALACTALTLFSRQDPIREEEKKEQPIDMTAFVKEQHPHLGVGDTALLLDAEMKRGRTYSEVNFRLEFGSEVEEWVSAHTPSAKLSLQRVRIPTGEREVPVVTFSKVVEAVYFKMRWA